VNGLICKQCGRGLRPNAPHGLCSVCLLGEGLTALRQAPEPVAPPGPGPVPLRVGDYELLEEIARGGMGVVYRARQLSLDRIVALKLILGGQLAGRDQAQRFRAEARAAANLQHPNIVAIHEVGEHAGQLFYAMDYIEGKDLASIISDLKFEISNHTRSVSWMKTVAEAVHYAHRQGVLHRDLKPANIIIDQHDQPRITDFGLAKRLEISLSSDQVGGSSGSTSGAGGPQAEGVATNAATGDAGPTNPVHSPLSTLHSPLPTPLTLSGQVLGSPSYLSPEMAEGKRGAVGVASDVYSLGAVLYHLVTGRPPFQGETLTALLRQVIETEPVAPRRLNPGIPRDLETLCLKCLEKEPRRRYSSAQEVADELGRYLLDEPIRARPASRAERFWRWCRRNPRLAGALGAAILSLVLGLVATSLQMRRAQRSEMATFQRAYVSDMDFATRALAEGDVGRVRDFVERYAPLTEPRASTGQRSSTINPRPSADLRGWEWAYLWMKSRSQGGHRFCTRPRQVSGLAFTADGQRLVVHERQGVTLVYDVSTGQPVPGLIQTNRSWRIGFCPVSNRVACQASPEPWQDGEVRLWDLESNSIVFRYNYPHDEFASFAFSPDGQRLAGFAYVRGVCLWDLANDGLMTSIPAEPAVGTIWTGAVALDPTGQMLAVGHRTNGLVRLHRVSDGRIDAEFRLPADPVVALAFSPDGRWLAASALTTNAVVRVWPLPSGEPMELAGQSITPLALAFHPRSEVLTTGDGQLIRLWDMQRRRPITALVGHRLGVTALAFSPDGRQLASGSNASGAEDAEVWLWDVAEVLRPVQPDFQVLSNVGLVAFERDARSFLALADGAVTRFDLITLEPIEPLRQYGTNNSSLSVSKDGRWLANAETNGMVHVWDRHTQQECASFCPYLDSHPERGTMRILARGRLLLSRPNNIVQHPMNLWDTRTGQQPEPWCSLNIEAQTGCITADDSMDGRLLATGQFDGRVFLWDAESGNQLAAFDAHRECVMEVAFSPDGRWLASAGWDGALRLWDVHQRVAAGQFGRTEAPAYGITFSPDGHRVASGGLTGSLSVSIWDVATRQHLTDLVGPGSFFFAPRFSPDGRTLAVWKYSEDVTCFWRVPALEDIDNQE